MHAYAYTLMRPLAWLTLFAVLFVAAQVGEAVICARRAYRLLSFVSCIDP